MLVLVDRLDLAVLRALRYAGSLRPTTVQAVHFMLDDQVAATLQHDWIERRLGDRVPLSMVECPDRRLVRGVAELALDTVVGDRAEVTVLLPRRTFGRLSQRLLHDRTADRIAEAVGRIPHVAATIVPFDTTLPHEQVERIEARQQRRGTRAGAEPRSCRVGGRTGRAAAAPSASADGVAADRLGGLEAAGDRRGPGQGGAGGHRRAGGRWRCRCSTSTGGVRLLFFGRTRIAGLEPGAALRATGRVGEYKGHLALANPKYELLAR